MARAEKGVLTQGTHVWVFDQLGTPALHRIFCLKSIDVGDDSVSDVDDACLDSDVLTTDWGAITPGEGSLVINTDPENESHLTLFEIASRRGAVDVYIGWSDGVGEPTLVDGDVELPPTRTWSYFGAKIRKGKPVFDPNSIVNHTLPMKRRTEVIEEFRPKN